MQTSIPRHPELEIKHDEQFQRHEWRVQRLFWLVWVLIILAALAGLLGPGPLSSQTIAVPEMTVKYDRFLHFHCPTSIDVYLQPTTSDNNEVRLWLAEQYLTKIRIQRISPQPERTIVNSDGHTWVFAAGEKGSVLINLHYQPDSVGPINCRLRAGNGEMVSFDQFVYP